MDNTTYKALDFSTAINDKSIYNSRTFVDFDYNLMDGVENYLNKNNIVTPLRTTTASIAAANTTESVTYDQPKKYVLPFYQNNTERILSSWGFLLDGKIRETEQEPGVLEYIELYSGSGGAGRKGLYHYNFCLNTDPFDTQPSGGMNLSKFNKVQFQIDVLTPTANPNVAVQTTCVTDSTGSSIGIVTNKTPGAPFLYDYELTVMEERYNILTIENGIAGLAFVR